MTEKEEVKVRTQMKLRWPVRTIYGVDVHPMWLGEQLERHTLDKGGVLRTALFFLGLFPAILLSLVIFSWASWLLNPPWVNDPSD